MSDVRNVESVAGASIGLRAIGGLRDGGQGAPFEVLAIEPGEFARIGIFRDDYAAKPLGELLSELEPESGLEANLPPLRLLDNPTQVGVRMKSSTSQEFIRASLRLLDAAGRSWSVDLGDMSSTDWGVRMGEVPESAVQPLDVVGIVFFEQANDELGTPMTVYIDDLMSSNTVVDGDVSATQITVVESFENTDAWLPLASSKGIDTQASGFDYQRNSATDHGLQIDLGVGTNRGIRGLIRTTVESVPALFSQEALALNGLTVGDRTIVHVFNQSVPFRVAGEVEYFPTVDPGQGGFLVADATQLWSYLSMSSFNSAGFLAEMFIGLEDPNDEEVISNVSMTIGGIHNLIIRDEIRQSSLVTPLAIAGWRGASVVATSIAIVVGLIGYQAFSPVRPAVAKFNLAVLSALGIGRRSLVMVSVVEQIVVLGTGIAIGLGTGFLMARLAAGATTQTMTAGDPLPPILFSTDWAYLVGLVAALGVVAAVTTILDLIVIRRVNLAMTMKGG
ncbi:MAG: hypothetical protein H8D69_00055 [Chloroflexi bacterium]|nr:hypothetical protein [Chloroflexota bacterium]